MIQQIADVALTVLLAIWVGAMCIRLIIDIRRHMMRRGTWWSK